MWLVGSVLVGLVFAFGGVLRSVGVLCMGVFMCLVSWVGLFGCEGALVVGIVYLSGMGVIMVYLSAMEMWFEGGILMGVVLVVGGGLFGVEWGLGGQVVSVAGVSITLGEGVGSVEGVVVCSLVLGVAFFLVCNFMGWSFVSVRGV
uniref:NADH dehydrogenase subunit 6 n=1 Tax=Polyacanthorhynchus caballeroi TaxID=178082 RepID=A0A140DJ73_9BILA|nr:NADH dehydrogenase subunit 6 [Polyacanthorhynchus caballeroi]AMK47827.1 NADH dehydrogenase subunit 6 [Polyacanthorhynchus caballeroi]